MLLSWLTYCSHTVKQLWMWMAKTGSTMVVENIKKLHLEPVSCEESTTKGKSFLRVTDCEVSMSTHTRLDIKLSVGILSRLVKSPTIALWVAAKPMLRFLLGTQKTRITINAGTSGSGMQKQKCKFTRLSAYSDSD